MTTAMHIYLLKEIYVNNTAATAADSNNRDKKTIFKSCAPFPNCVNKINNTQIDNAELYSDNFSKTSGSLWQYCKEVPAVDNAGDIVDFNGANATDSFNFETKITGQTNNDGIINV